ncbi:MAG: peroxiredoxin [Thermosynechococcaceae cyanobacterium]
MAVKVGDSAPDFTLKSNKGKSVKLQSLYKRKPVVLYFYPKDNTPGCTKEACGFRDSYEEFKTLGAEVVGISSDSVDSHKAFAASHSLPFELLSDEGDQVRKLYGVPSTLGLLPGRVTYIIDKKGIVQKIFNSQLNVGGHIKTAIKTLEKLK